MCKRLSQVCNVVTHTDVKSFHNHVQLTFLYYLHLKHSSIKNACVSRRMLPVLHVQLTTIQYKASSGVAVFHMGHLMTSQS